MRSATAGAATLGAVQTTSTVSGDWPGKSCGKALGGQFGLRARCRVVGRELPGERPCRGDGRDQRDDPAQEHETPAAEGEVGKAGKWRGGAHDRGCLQNS
jgi:hypothetical protein